MALGNPRQAGRLLQPKQEDAHPQFYLTNASSGDLNDKCCLETTIMRHVEREPSYKLQKYLFCSVLYSFVLNYAIDGDIFFQDRFQSREDFFCYSVDIYFGIFPSSDSQLCLLYTKKPVQLHASDHRVLPELAAFCR